MKISNIDIEKDNLDLIQNREYVLTYCLDLEVRYRENLNFQHKKVAHRLHLHLYALDIELLLYLSFHDFQ